MVLVLVAQAPAAHNLQLEVADTQRPVDIAAIEAVAAAAAVVAVVAAVAVVRIVVPVVHSCYLNSVVVASHTAVHSFRSAFAVAASVAPSAAVRVAEAVVVIAVVFDIEVEAVVVAVAPDTAAVQLALVERIVAAQPVAVANNFRSELVVDLNSSVALDCAMEQVVDHNLAPLVAAEFEDEVFVAELVVVVKPERAAIVERIDSVVRSFA